MMVIKFQEDKLDRASNRLKAIAHPQRLMIVCALEKGAQSVSDIQEVIQVEQAVVSQHLKVLRDKDVLDCRREGTKKLYFLKYPAIEGIIRALERCESC